MRLNFLPSSAGHVGLIDFNVATKIDKDNKETSLKGLYGTPPYIAPEMWVILLATRFA